MKNSKFIIFLGLPGSGKGTQSKLLTESFPDNYVSLSTGEAIRKILKEKNNSELYEKLHNLVSNGLLVDDQIVCEIVENEILSWAKNLKNLEEKNFTEEEKSTACGNFSEKNNNYILDGFPRTESQCIMIEDFLKKTEIGKIDLVVFFDLKKRIAIKRLLYRLICNDCGNIQSSFGLKKHEIENLKCVKCRGKLEKRKDDHIGAVRKRLKNDKKIIDFLLKFYQNRSTKCVKLNAALKINVLHKKIKNIIDLL